MIKYRKTTLTIIILASLFIAGCSALNEFGKGFEEGLKASGTSYYQSNPAGGSQAVTTVGDSICYTTCLPSGICQTSCH